VREARKRDTLLNGGCYTNLADITVPDLWPLLSLSTSQQYSFSKKKKANKKEKAENNEIYKN
jgi:hypothetical protein